MMQATFTSVWEKQSWSDIHSSILNKREKDVENAIYTDHCDLEDFKALLSPAADRYLEEMAQRSLEITRRRFGHTITLYAPMYLSNECQNICTYCGFSLDNKIRRKTLTGAEILQEIQYLKSKGFDHVLLVTGEAQQLVGMEYFLKVLPLFKKQFTHISMEVQPLHTAEYSQLYEAGLHGIFVYQETYDSAQYKKVHPKGRKSNFKYRLETPDRIGQAELYKIGLGVLLGLSDWRTDSFFLRHAPPVFTTTILA